MCIAFGPKFTIKLPALLFGNAAITWTDNIKYLGVSKSIRSDIGDLKP